MAERENNPPFYYFLSIEKSGALALVLILIAISNHPKKRGNQYWQPLFTIIQ
jgi:hypothetical protein